MAINYTTLRTDIQSGPLAASCTPLVAAGNDQGVADLFNATTGAGAGPVNIGTVLGSDFLTNFAPALFSLPGLSTTIQTKWDRILRFLGSLTTVRVGATNVQTLLSTAVTDAVLTQNQVNNINAKATGSRAEVLFGDGTFLSLNDIAKALGRG
jgi:hypothetical protein